MDPLEFHQMMDAEKAKSAVQPVGRPSTAIWTERSWPTWGISSQQSRKRAAKSRRVAIARWKRGRNKPERISVRALT